VIFFWNCRFTSVVVLLSSAALPPHKARKSCRRYDNFRPDFGNGIELALVTDGGTTRGDIVAVSWDDDDKRGASIEGGAALGWVETWRASVLKQQDPIAAMTKKGRRNNCYGGHCKFNI
jgi:hypothetical protein